MASRAVGFAYVLSNPAMPGIVKVGRTTALAADLAREINSPAVPLPYEVEFEALTSFPQEAEATAHQMLGTHRIAPGRPFFRVAPSLAVEAVRDALADAAGLAAWNSGKVHQVQAGDRIAVTVMAGDMFVVLAYPTRTAERAEPVDLWQAHADGDQLELMAADAASLAALSDHGTGTGLDQARPRHAPVPYQAGPHGSGPHGTAPNETGPNETGPSGTVNGRERLVPGDRLLWVRPTAEGACRTAFEFSAHCHVVSRTWNPRFTPDGVPLRLAYPATDQQPACVIQATHDALALPRPRAWAPREPDPEDDWLAAVIDDPLPGHRLDQLSKRHRSRAKSAAANHAPPDQIPLW